MATMTTLLASSITSSATADASGSTNLLDYHIPEAIQIQVTKVETSTTIQAQESDILPRPILYTGTNVASDNVCTFCVDPQITSLSIVQTLVVRAFNLSSEFQLNYYDWKSHRRLSIVDDEQLNRAYLEASHPFLDINLMLIDYPLVEVSSNDNILSTDTITTTNNNNNNRTMLPITSTPKESSRSYQSILSEWDVVTSSDVILAQTITKTNNFILNQIEKIRNKAKNFSSPNQPTTIGAINSWFLAETIFQYIIDTTGSAGAEKVPLDDITFRTFLDPEGRILSQRDLRITIYRRGVQPGLRKVIWKHLLNVYPEGYSGQERLDFIKIRCDTYRDMRKLWQANLATDKETANLANMIRKDVLRTDRQHPFYASNGSTEATTNGDNFEFDNENVTQLFNMLLTYALNHRHKYCQGMSDLASPLLYVMKDEAHAYISFCALMRRLGDNFSTDGVAITRKFAHLKALLQHYDLEFYNYLRLNGAHDLLFCYRWLLLDLKREFEFEDTLQMLEVLWASIPPKPSDAAYLNLFDDGYLYIPNRGVDDAEEEGAAKAPEVTPTPTTTTTTPSQPMEPTRTSTSSMVEQLKSNNLLPKDEEKRKNFEFTINHCTFNSQDFFVATPETMENAEVAIEAHEEILDQMVKESCSSSSGDDSSSSCSTNDSGVMGSRLLTSGLATETTPEVARATEVLTPRRRSEVNRRRRRRLFGGQQMAQEEEEDDDEVIVFDDDTISVTNRSHSTSIAGDDHDNASEAAAILVRTFSMDSNDSRERHRSRDRRTPRTPSFSFARNLLSIGKSVSVDSLSSVTSGYDGKSIDSKLTNNTAPVVVVGGGGRQGSPTGSIANGSMVVGPIEIEMSELDECGRRKSVADEADHELETRMSKLNANAERRDPCLSNIFSTSTSSLVILSTVSESQIDPDLSESVPATPNSLLTPDELGPSEAFMLFLCLTLLLQNRDKIIEQNMDRNDIQMCFDSMVRKHNVKSVLRDARNLFHTYLSQWHKECLHA